MAETLDWIDVNGNVYSLSDTQRFFAIGPNPAQGAFGLPIKIVSHQVPLLPGVQEQWIEIDANDIRFPLNIMGASAEAIDVARRLLSEAMRPTRGVGILQHTSNDGQVRQLYCREISRLRDVVERGPGHIQVGLQFSAADPFWYDENWTAMTFTPGGATTFFQDPFFPLHLSVGGLSSSFTIENLGQAETWPVWTVTGPGLNPTLTNSTTGNVLTCNINLATGQVLTIDTRPGTIAITREDGSNQWATISDTSTIWPFVVGPNAVQLSMSSTDTDSQLQLQYKQRYEGV